MADPVELGFLEKVERPEDFNSSLFPSKVGGKPVWVDQSNIPSPQEIACVVCGKPRVFLLQIYAPLPDTPDELHRTFFLFMCLNSSCHRTNDACGFAVFRCQLPKRMSMENSASEPVSECAERNGVVEVSASGHESTHCRTTEGQSDITEQSVPSQRGNDTAQGGHSETLDSNAANSSVNIEDALEQMTVIVRDSDETRAVESGASLPLCIVCGCSGPKKCSKCKVAHYCSRDHQTHDWRNGHKLFCSDLSTGKCKLNELSYDPGYGLTLPEFEIVTEDEPEIRKKPPETSEEERMREYHKYVQSKKYQEGGKDQEKESKTALEKAESNVKHDKVFKAFKQRIAVEPEQVIRYQRGGQPLLVSKHGAPKSSDVLQCVCGAEREFEFQVMPQLLYYLKLDTISDHSVDWGTVLVYSCTASCSHGGFQTEVVWKQDFSSNVS